jgi:hypothetical protein
MADTTSMVDTVSSDPSALIPKDLMESEGEAEMKMQLPVVLPTTGGSDGSFTYARESFIVSARWMAFSKRLRHTNKLNRPKFGENLEIFVPFKNMS